jgi:hypothetical protein
MMKRTALLLPLLLLTTMVRAQGLTNWVEERRKNILAARAEQNDVAVKQTESPATAAGSTSLVDQSSTADLVSGALNFAGLGGDEASTGDGAKTISLTAYSLLAAARGFDPLDPQRYNEHRHWRRLSFTAGTSDTESVYALKYTFINRHDAQDLSPLQPLLDAASQASGDVTNLVAHYILTTPSVIHRLESEATVGAAAMTELARGLWGPKGNLFPPPPPQQPPADADPAMVAKASADALAASNRFVNAQTRVIAALEDDAVRDRILDADNLREIDALIEANLGSFETLQKATAAAIENINAKPQFAITATHKQVANGADRLVAELVYDQGMPGTSMLITGNAGYERTEGDDPTSAGDFFRFAGQLRVPLGGAGSRRFLDFAAEANNRDHQDVFKAQAKLTFPLAAGIDLPLSLTWTNNSDLNEEKEIRGLIGFTLDYAQLLNMLRR